MPREYEGQLDLMTEESNARSERKLNEVKASDLNEAIQDHKGPVDVTVQAIIDEGDHMAVLLARVLAGQYTPQLTLNNAIDNWDRLMAELEGE